MNDKPLYDWQDKDGQAKLQKILTKLLDNGYNARMSNNKMFVSIMGETPRPICEAYSSSWHSRGLIQVYEGFGVPISERKSTFSADEAYDMLIKIYEEATK
jgi:hypothetical protein